MPKRDVLDVNRMRECLPPGIARGAELLAKTMWGKIRPGVTEHELELLITEAMLEANIRFDVPRQP